MSFFQNRFAITVTAVLLLSGLTFSQPPGYYLSAEGKTGTALQQALHEIIDDHTVQTYGSLWTWFQTTDKKTDGTVWDIYSDIPAGTPLYTYQFSTNQCGNYDSEGDCYNREHSFPKSWFNDLEPMYTDLFHIYPTDGWVNNKRGNYPFGVTNTPSWISTNGSKVGPSSYPGYTGTIFEPLSAYKGDFARTMFYMAVRYYGEDSGWPGSDMVSGSQLKEWALKMCMEWHKNDPVSQKESERNNSVYIAQGNRNPFIDNPGNAELIWGAQSSSNDEGFENPEIKIFPNPAEDIIKIELDRVMSDGYKISLIDLTGRSVISLTGENNSISLDVSNLSDGIYILLFESGDKIIRSRIVISR